MEQPGISDNVLDAASVPDAIRRWITGGSVEAIEFSEQLGAIAGFFDHLDTAIENLGHDVDRRAYRLVQQVRAQMIRGLLIDINEQLPTNFAVSEE